MYSIILCLLSFIPPSDMDILILSDDQMIVSRANLWNNLTKMLEWKDSTETKSITAKYISDEDRVVILEKEDKTQIKIEFSKLSKKDQLRISSIHRLLPKIEEDLSVEFKKIEHKLEVEKKKKEVESGRRKGWQELARRNIVAILPNLATSIPRTGVFTDVNGVNYQINVANFYFGERNDRGDSRGSNRRDIEYAMDCYNKKNYNDLDNRSKQSVVFGLVLTRYIPIHGEAGLTGEEVAREFHLVLLDPDIDRRLDVYYTLNLPIFPHVFDHIDKTDTNPLVQHITNIYKELNK